MGESESARSDCVADIIIILSCPPPPPLPRRNALRPKIIPCVGQSAVGPRAHTFGLVPAESARYTPRCSANQPPPCYLTPSFRQQLSCYNVPGSTRTAVLKIRFVYDHNAHVGKKPFLLLLFRTPKFARKNTTPDSVVVLCRTPRCCRRPLVRDRPAATAAMGNKCCKSQSSTYSSANATIRSFSSYNSSIVR